MLTDKLFTGQREMAGLGIYHYNARFYSPKLGRFLSADTIVPGYANPQNPNRYSYVMNNPLRYIDPTGHKCVSTGPGDCLNNKGKPINGAGGLTPKPKKKPGNNGGGGNGGGGMPPVSGSSGGSSGTSVAEAVERAVEYCPFGMVCRHEYDYFWEQLAKRVLPAYADGSKHELYGTYGFFAAGTQGITIVTTPDGRFVVYHEHSEFGQTATLGPNLSVTSSKGIVFGIKDPIQYSGDAVSGSGSAFILGGAGWTTPDGELSGVDANATFGVNLPGLTASHTEAEPLGSGQYTGFMFFFCRAVLAGCGR